MYRVVNQKSTDVIDMGRKSAARCGVGVFGTGRMRGCFNWLGTADVTDDVLIRSATGPQRTGAASPRNQPGSWSSPVVVGRRW